MDRPLNQLGEAVMNLYYAIMSGSVPTVIRSRFLVLVPSVPVSFCNGTSLSVLVPTLVPRTEFDTNRIQEELVLRFPLGSTTAILFRTLEI